MPQKRLRNVIHDLSGDHFFSLATAASNHGNNVPRPASVLQRQGIQLKLLDFYPDAKEDAVNLYTSQNLSRSMV